MLNLRLAVFITLSTTLFFNSVSHAQETVMFRTDDNITHKVSTDIVRMCVTLNDMAGQPNNYYQVHEAIPLNGIDEARFAEFIDFLNESKKISEVDDVKNVDQDVFETYLDSICEGDELEKLYSLIKTANFLQAKLFLPIAERILDKRKLTSTSKKRKRELIDDISKRRKIEPTDYATPEQPENSSGSDSEMHDSNSSASTKNITIQVTQTNSSGRDSTPPFYLIPPDVLKEIFNHLNFFDSGSFLLVSKLSSKMFLLYTRKIVAQKPQQADIVPKALKLIKENTQTLENVKNVVIWDVLKNPIKGEELFPLLAQCTNLQRLALGKGSKAFTFSDETFALLGTCTNLEFLEVDHLPTSLHAIKFLPQLKNIKSLRIRGINGEQGPALLDLIKETTSLEKLGIWLGKGVIPASILGAIKSKNCNELILSSIKLDEGKDYTEDFISLKNLSLEHLGLFFSEVDDKYFALLLDINSLTSLHVGGVWILDNNTFQKLKNLPKLANLSLSRSSTLNATGIQNIVNLAKISTLRLSNCPLIQDIDLQSLANSTSLKRLDLDNCRLITDNFLINTLPHCSALTQIVLLDIPSITDMGMLNLRNMDHLTNITIKRCANTTVIGAQQLAVHHKNSSIVINHTDMNGNIYTVKKPSSAVCEFLNKHRQYHINLTNEFQLIYQKIPIYYINQNVDYFNTIITEINAKFSEFNNTYLTYLQESQISEPSAETIQKRVDVLEQQYQEIQHYIDTKLGSLLG